MRRPARRKAPPKKEARRSNSAAAARGAALADLITTAPRLSDPDAARLACPTGWTSVPAANSKSLKSLFSERPIIGTLVALSGRKLAVSLGFDRPRAGPVSAVVAGKSRTAFCVTPDRPWRCRSGEQGRSRGDATASPNEGRRCAADRACRYRRRVAGDAGSPRAHRTCRCRGWRSRRFALAEAAARGGLS